eukprot:8212681-Ditylum_brightwellii.AAC.1
MKINEEEREINQNLRGRNHYLDDGDSSIQRVSRRLKTKKVSHSASGACGNGCGGRQDITSNKKRGNGGFRRRQLQNNQNLFVEALRRHGFNVTTDTSIANITFENTTRDETLFAHKEPTEVEEA